MNEIWLGDMARALDAVGSGTAAQRRMVALMLGFRGRSAGHRLPPSAPLRKAPNTSATREPVSGRASANGEEDTSAAADEVTARLPDARSTGGVPGAEARLIGYTSLRTIPVGEETLPRASAAGLLARPPHTPLFARRYSRAVLHGLLTQYSPDGPIDHNALVRHVARRRLTDLPRLSVRTMRFGVQVLVDQGEAMAPFRRDQADVVHQVRTLVGATQTEVVYFAESPLQGRVSEEPAWTWRENRLPPPRTRILLLSTLGSGGGWTSPHAVRAEWKRFAELAYRRNCTVAVLIPRPRRLWPVWADGLFTLLPWDRRTTSERPARS
ncbi:hypothetical protein AB0J80_09195 [Actinoplanes sp. NPDC049548]|uniref:hypothetical protein n=1 Tax=Actinoplanes sp. NPDC049548 TaxID=3155152 RepID=UPI00343EB41D